jgi:hypothetical protein
VNADALFVRFRALCCSAWGIPPWEFDAAAEEGRIAAEDAVEAALVVASSSMGSDVIGYLFREKAAAKRRKLEAMKQLVTQYRATEDPARRAELQRAMDELNRG